MESDLDDLDNALVDALCRDGRQSWADLASQLGVSPPTIKQRVARLEAMGVITGFTAVIAPKAMGYALEAIIRFKPFPGKLHLLQRQIEENDRIVQCDKVTGEDGFVTRVLLTEIAELDAFLEPFTDKASTHTAIVKSSPVPMRQPPTGGRPSAS